MKKLSLSIALSLCLAGAANADWVHVKTIDVTASINGSVKSLAIDSTGDILFTTYFGTGNRPIYRLENPLSATPTVTTFSTTEYASTNGSDLTVDASGNVYFIHDTNSEATSYIRKFDSSGNLVTTFGTGGTLSPVVFNIEGTPTNRRPRAASVVAGGKLLAFSWGTPMVLSVLDAATGAPVGPAANTGAATAIVDSIQGLGFDPATNTIFGNLRGNLYTITSTNPAATLDNLGDYTVYTKLAGETYPAGQSNIGGSWDEESGLYAFTSTKVAPGTVTIVDLAAPSNQTVLGAGLPVNDPAYLGNSGDVAFMRTVDDLYLVVSAETLRSFVIFRLESPTSVSNWLMHE